MLGVRNVKMIEEGVSPPRGVLDKKLREEASMEEKKERGGTRN